jgi:hypothetical protein
MPGRRLAVVALLVTSALVVPMRPASADATWPDLVKRIVTEQPRGPHDVVAGRLPDGFTYPAGIRPQLPVLGAIWFSLLPKTPQHVHVYFAPSPRTNEAVTALVAQLRAAHYIQSAGSPYPNGFVGDTPQGQTWCSGDGKGYTIMFDVRDAGGVPALDIQFSASGMFACDRTGGGPLGSDLPIPVLRAIPGMEIFAGMRGLESREHSVGSFGIIRTRLAANDVLAKLAQPFTAAGWTARVPVSAGGVLLQHFSRVQGSFRYNALLLIEPRSGSTTLYDAALDVTRDLTEDGAR